MGPEKTKHIYLEAEVIRTWKQEEFQILIMELLMQFYHTLCSKASSQDQEQTLWRWNSVLLRYAGRYKKIWLTTALFMRA